MLKWLGIIICTLRSVLRSRRELALDFFTVPTATFKVLFVLVILSQDRRRVLHFNVTAHPTVAWTGRQLPERLHHEYLRIAA